MPAITSENVAAMPDRLPTGTVVVVGRGEYAVRWRVMQYADGPADGQPRYQLRDDTAHPDSDDAPTHECRHSAIVDRIAEGEAEVVALPVRDEEAREALKRVLPIANRHGPGTQLVVDAERVTVSSEGTPRAEPRVGTIENEYLRKELSERLCDELSNSERTVIAQHDKWASTFTLRVRDHRPVPTPEDAAANAGGDA